MAWRLIYWGCQISGWLLFILLNLFFFQLDQDISSALLASLSFTFIYGILSTHFYRNVLVKYRLLRLSILRLIPLFLLSSLLLGVTYHFINRLFLFFIFGISADAFFSVDELPDILNISLIYLVWTLIYFLVHYVRDYKKEEIKNLRFEAAHSEMEYITLKSQLNPHFLFNALNSIRALIDENPVQAKTAVTSLASMLRTSLQLDKRKTIPFRDELQLVRDYLHLESMRYEERLRVEYSIDENSLGEPVPPMMLQTLVENAIKHGISKMPGGGEILISSKIKDNFLKITVSNSGALSDPSLSETAIGINNIRKRLSLLYGSASGFEIRTSGKSVIAELTIPCKS